VLAFLAEFIAFLDPQMLIDMWHAEAMPNYEKGELGGVVKNLNINLFIYRTDLFGLGLGGANFKILDAGIYLIHDPVEAGLDEVPPL